MGKIPVQTKANEEGTIEELSILIIIKVIAWVHNAAMEQWESRH